MIKILSNKIEIMISAAVAKTEDATVREKLISEMEKYIPKYRVTGLIKNKFKLTLNEVLILRKIFNCTIDDLLIIEEE